MDQTVSSVKQRKGHAIDAVMKIKYPFSHHSFVRRTSPCS